MAIIVLPLILDNWPLPVVDITKFYTLVTLMLLNCHLELKSKMVVLIKEQKKNSFAHKKNEHKNTNMFIFIIIYFTNVSRIITSSSSGFYIVAW